MRKLFILTSFLLFTSGCLQAQADSIVRFEVYFDLDKASIGSSQKAKIDSVLEVAPIGIIRKLKIYGHTDSLAGVEYNRKLSKNRVLSILQYFVSKSFDPLYAQTDFYGEERPKYDNGPDERFRNRRCEVELYIDESLLPRPEQKLSDLELKKGDKLRIPKLNFVGNQPIPIASSIPTLTDLVVLMKVNPDMQVDIQGHVCCADDRELSVARAFTIYQFLIANGISRDRMTYKGFSNTKPLFKETNDEAKALNRRVELEIKNNSKKRNPAAAEESVVVDLRAPVLNIKFFTESGRLKPSGDFMLTLVADAMKESEGVQYEFIVYNSISNSGVTRQRAKALEKQIKRKGVDARVFSVSEELDPKRMKLSENDNIIIVQIKPR
jgi:outer membrane protein OmpA-like peptidoglycan-associated protein